MATSTATLTSLKTRVAQFMGDPTSVVFDSDTLAEGVRLALGELNRAVLYSRCPFEPNRQIGTVTPAAAAREVSLAALTGLVTVEDVWFPYLAADASPKRVNYLELVAAGVHSIRLLGDTAGDGARVARVLYIVDHTLNGLDTAAATTFDSCVDGALVIGAAGHCCFNRSFYNIEDTVTGTFATPNYAELGARLLEDFRAMLGLSAYVPDTSFSLADLEPTARKARGGDIRPPILGPNRGRA